MEVTSKRRALGRGLEELFYNEPIDYNKVEEKIITESILKGFDNNEFKMYLQFIVDNKTKCWIPL